MMSEHLDNVYGAERDGSTSRTSDPSTDLRGCTSECRSVTPPRAQPEEMQDPSEAQRGGNGHVNTYRPLIGTLKEVFPENSTLRGRHHAYLGDRTGTVAAAALRLHEQDGDIDLTYHSPDKVWAQLEAANPEHAIIVVEGIDDIWCDALCARYPDSINERFLLEHILGLTFEFVNKEVDSPTPTDRSGYTSVEADIRLIANALSDRADLFHAEEHGFRVNNWYEADRRPGDTMQHCRGDCIILQYYKSGRIKLDCFISGCRLDKNVYLVLLVPRIYETMHEEAFNGKMQVSDRFRGYRNEPFTIDLPSCSTWRMITTLSTLLASEWPVFVWKTTANGENAASAQDDLDGYLLATLLIISVLRCDVTLAKGEMVALAYLQQHIDDHGHFAKLTRFRRTLGRLHHAINGRLTDTRQGWHEWYIDGTIYRQDLLPTPSPHTSTSVLSNASPQPDLKEVISDRLSKLQATLSYIKAELNEELQVAVGAAVQVEDAQVTKTQTNMTVVLTILAVIYLPMTLVTGIFGMNVAEINRIANSPKAWVVFVAWVVSIVVTVGSGLLVWKLWKLWTAKKARKQSDIETGYKSDYSGSGRWRLKHE